MNASVSTETELQLCEPATPDEIDGYPDYLAERKLDGVRVYAHDGRLFTRSGRDVTAQLPEIDPPEGTVLDGELVTADLSFESANRRVQTEDRFKIDLLADQSPAFLAVFDVLVHDGLDVRDKPLTERKDLLDQSLPSDTGLVPVTVHDDPMALWDQAVADEWEGIILKPPDDPYRGGKRERWLKVKRWKEQTFPIVGSEHTENDGFVIYVSIGTEEPQRVVVNGREDQAVVQNGADMAEIQYLERSKDGRLRKPSFKGVA